MRLHGFLAAAFGLFGWAVIASGAGAADERALNVYNWNDYIARDTIPAFEKATGIAVKYDLYDSNATLQGKLLAGSSGYDVVYPSVEYAGRQIQAGIFQPLDKARLPNYSNLDPLILKAVERADPGNRFVVPYMWYTTGVAINVDRVEKALGGKLPDNAWDLLFDPAVTARLKGCGIALMDEASDVIPAAMIYIGADTSKMAPADIRAAVERIRPVRRDIRVFNSSPIDLMAKGSVCVAMMFSGDALIAARRANESHTGANVRYLIPKAGAMMSVDVMAIPRDAPHVANAHAWINTMLDPKVVAQISNETYYLSANKAALPLTAAEITGNPAINVPEALKRHLQAKPVLTQDAQRELTQAFNRFKTAR
ncbi:polyamine ABC transporter substrate-binding protein [Azoarcus sp. DN11]|uniref:polyamine ABC transporter substrate-binding protein n=1 Tax=Azoarcus sp. DN11 TaxID=356837 RepID=UPI000EB30F63|nr:polyamine ABC transporter substrate-binding protein [Azoarcus sp. DN11]AYH41946.1 spermidine/putrescine ABC transporter substrate-binding protein PotF [Azoarcus sp. DN11]